MGTALFGYEIHSELPLGRLRDAPSPRGRLALLKAEGSLVDASGELVGWIQRSDPPWFMGFARVDGSVVGVCSDTGAFRLAPERRCLYAQPANATDERWQHVMVATAIPLLLSQLGDLVLHASALATDTGAVLFCGPSGRGKSTLALGLATAQRRLVGEDGTAISFTGNGPVAWPGPDGVRLASAPGEPKRVHDASPRATVTAPTPVGAVVVLGPRTDGDLCLQRLERADAVPALFSHALHAPGEGLPGAFSLVARLARRTPVYRASIPDGVSAGLAAAAEVVERVLR